MRRVTRVASIAAALAAVSCASATPAPGVSDPPPLDAPPANEAAQPASSAEVRDGMERIQKGDFAGAKRALTSARASRPNDPQAAFYLAVALEGLGETDDAIAAYRRTLELDPRLTDASVNLSALLLDQRAPADALRVADLGLRHASKHPDLLMNRALALEATGKRDEAAKAYGQAVAARPNNLELRYTYAELLAATGRKDQALEQLQRLAHSEDPRLAQAVANLYGQLEAYGECVAALDTILQRKPSPELYVRRGVCRHQMEDEPGAKADYQAALERDPSFAAAHYYLGMHYRQAGNSKLAGTHLGHAREHGKGTPIAAAADKALSELKGAKPDRAQRGAN